MPHSRLRRPGQAPAVRFLLGAYEFFASIRLAVVVIAAMVVILATATFIDRNYGASSRASNFAVYETWWFALANAVLGLNVVCAALIRFPWRRAQIPFLIIHAGIALLLFGAGITRQQGIDASLPVFESQSSFKAFRQTQRFRLSVFADSDPGAARGVVTPKSNAATVDIPFAAGPFNWGDYQRLAWFPWRWAPRDRGVLYDKEGIRLEVLDYYADSASMSGDLRVAQPPPAVSGEPAQPGAAVPPSRIDGKSETVVEPKPFRPKKSAARKQRCAKVKLTVDGASQQFWLLGMYDDPVGESLPAENRRIVAGKERRAALTLAHDSVDVGFQVYLHKFVHKLEPGSMAASYYGSVVDFRDRRNPDKRLRGDVLITMNEPANFSDPASGRSFRFYQESFNLTRPGDPAFEAIVGGLDPRDHLYQSYLTANYDPGRGWKYAGCLLISLGTMLVFYMKRHFFSKRPRHAAVLPEP